MHRLNPSVLIDIQPISHAFVAPLNQPILIKGDGVKGLITVEQRQLQVSLSNNTLLKYFEFPIKQRLWKTLPPWHGLQNFTHQRQGNLVIEFPITDQHLLQILGAKITARLFVKQPSKLLEVSRLNGQASSHGVATKFLNKPGIFRINSC